MIILASDVKQMDVNVGFASQPSARPVTYLLLLALLAPARSDCLRASSRLDDAYRQAGRARSAESLEDGQRYAQRAQSAASRAERAAQECPCGDVAAFAREAVRYARRAGEADSLPLLREYAREAQGVAGDGHAAAESCEVLSTAALK